MSGKQNTKSKARATSDLWCNIYIDFNKAFCDIHLRVFVANHMEEYGIGWEHTTSAWV